MNQNEIKNKINWDWLSAQTGLDNVVLDIMLNSIFDSWNKFDNFLDFPCLKGCSACCSNGAVTFTTLEFAIAKTFNQDKDFSNNGFGCLFKNKRGCSIYPVRPLACRLFGYQIPFEFPIVMVNDNFSGQAFAWSVLIPGHCAKIKNKILGFEYRDELSSFMLRYREFVDKAGILIVGTFKDPDLNGGLMNINKLWGNKYKKEIWVANRS